MLYQLSHVRVGENHPSQNRQAGQRTADPALDTSPAGQPRPTADVSARGVPSARNVALSASHRAEGTARAETPRPNPPARQPRPKADVSARGVPSARNVALSASHR